MKKIILSLILIISFITNANATTKEKEKEEFTKRVVCLFQFMKFQEKKDIEKNISPNYELYLYRAAESCDCREEAKDDYNLFSSCMEDKYKVYDKMIEIYNKKKLLL